MFVQDILNAKGLTTLVIQPTETIEKLAAQLRDERVGVMLVSIDGERLTGIISERDIAYNLTRLGTNLGTAKVSELMTRNVITCTPQDTIEAVASVMTRRRIRHIPVVDNERMSGIISIGDVLKHRIGEIELEKDVLRDIAIANR